MSTHQENSEDRLRQRLILIGRRNRRLDHIESQVHKLELDLNRMLEDFISKVRKLKQQ
jgi:hypothetical protein